MPLLESYIFKSTAQVRQNARFLTMLGRLLAAAFATSLGAVLAAEAVFSAPGTFPAEDLDVAWPPFFYPTAAVLDFKEFRMRIFLQSKINSRHLMQTMVDDTHPVIPFPSSPVRSPTRQFLKLFSSPWRS